MRRLFFCAISVLLASVWICRQACGAETYGLDLHNQPIRQLAGSGVRLVVLLFAASDCPISNRYVPEVARLNREYAPHGVRIWWVFPNPDDESAKVAQHAREFGISEGVILDRAQTLVRLAHASVTPEAALFSVHGDQLNELYRGRIDDRYASIGQERPQAGRHDLEAAIDAALHGRAVVRPQGPPVGCSIVFLDK